MVSDILYGLLSLIVLMIGAWCRSQEKKIGDFEAKLEKNATDFSEKLELATAAREAFGKEVMARWVRDVETYVTKADFNSLAKEIKESLVRIEDKIENLR